MRGNRRVKALMLALAALAATLVLAACGGGDDVGGASDNEAQTAEPGPVEG